MFAKSYSLHNFGPHCKALIFQFLSILSNCTTHSGDLKALLEVNNSFLTSILTCGAMTIQLHGAAPVTLPVTLQVTADDLML